MSKIVIASFEIPGVFSEAEAASQLTRAIRTHDRSYENGDIVQLPLVDGGEGTIDFLVTNTLGSFLEVETTDAKGIDTVVPIGFTGEDGKLAVIEMKRAAEVMSVGEHGTTYGIGELIRDALDEGAFSVLLGLDEPIASDGGLSIAAALGVKFLDAKGRTLEMNAADPPISKIARVDASGRSFELLSSRFFIGVTRAASQTTPSKALLTQLDRLSEIILRDCEIHASTQGLTASAAAFGLRAFLGAEVQDGRALVLEAAQAEKAIFESPALLIIANDLEQLEEENAKKLIRSANEMGKQITVVLAGHSAIKEGEECLYSADSVFSLADVTLFQPPVPPNAGLEERRRDTIMRIEKIIPKVVESLQQDSFAKR